MSKIPGQLAARFEALQKLEEARDLLRRLPPDGSEIERICFSEPVMNRRNTFYRPRTPGPVHWSKGYAFL